MKRSATQLIIRFGIITLIGITLTGCKPQATDPNAPGTKGTAAPKTITIWRPFDSDEVFKPIIKDFQIDNPNVTVVYKQIPADEYELTVSEALAAGEGPDIWSIRNDWIPRHKNKLIPMQDGLLATFVQNQKTDEDRLKSVFVPVVNKDVFLDGKIYGLPYSADTLVLYKNKAVFDTKSAQLRRESRDAEADFLLENFNTYDKLQRAIQLLTERTGDQITIAGLAAGTSNNVTRAEDIVYAMMLQNHTEMTSVEHTNASFHLGVKDAVGQTTFPGTDALQRFTNFADPSKPYYTWNASMPNDMQAFMTNKAAMIFGYQYYELAFKQQAPNLQYSVMPFPQIRDTDTPIDYPSYYVETVTKNAKDPQLAWQVLANLVIQRGDMYRQADQRPSPKVVSEPPTVILRADKTNPFAYEQQTAVDWYKTKRPDKVDAIFRDLIQRVGTRQQAAQNAIEAAAQQVSTLLQQEQSK
jgi:ABC-type glycerol-3-phosphate transport system substrate-binding protein